MCPTASPLANSSCIVVTVMEYHLVRSRRRRRSVALQLNPQGELVVRAPLLMPKFFIDRFVAGHQDWISRQREMAASPRQPRRLYFATLDLLEEYIRAEVARYAALMGVRPRRVLFRQVTSYWGNCSPQGVIRFNLHLRYTPPVAVTYVVVHELCHLRWRGHGPRFWAMVHKYLPQAEDSRRILRQIAKH